MIITVTANPAVDVIYSLRDTIVCADLNRAYESRVFAGGKGINVSRAIKSAGGDSEAAVLLGGYVGGMLEKMLLCEGMSVLKVPSLCETRVNICAVSSNGDATEINAPGGPVSFQELENLASVVVEKASFGDVVILAGSLPKCDNYDKNLFLTNFISDLKSKGCKVILDCSGDALRASVEGSCPPDIIKPNFCELIELVPELSNEDLSDEDKVFEITEKVCEKIAKKGISVLATLGSAGALYTSSNAPSVHIRQKSFHVDHISNIKGAGDTFLGTFVYHKFILNNDEKTSMNHAAKAAADHVGGNYNLN